MPKKKGAHHSLDDKMRDRKHAQRGRTLSRDCREAQASPTTVSNEVKLSRALQCPRRRRRGAQGARLRQGRALPPLLLPCCGLQALRQEALLGHLRRARSVCPRSAKAGTARLRRRATSPLALRRHMTRLSAAHADTACEPGELKNKADKVKGLLFVRPEYSSYLDDAQI